MFAAARDVTELKRIDHRLQQKNIELRRSPSRMKSEFLANMSHELRTPLNAIIGFSEVLKDGLIGEMTAQQRGFIGDIFRSGKHLLSLINDILDLSKVEAGKIVLDLETVQVSRSGEQPLHHGERKRPRVESVSMIDAAGNWGRFTADARKVKQIVYNLLSNAVKFTNDGGEVTLRARRTARADVGQSSGVVEVPSFPLADNVRATFSRSASSIAASASVGGVGAIVQPFSQIDSGLARNTPKAPGSGLAMVKLLAELHGGTVECESAVGTAPASPSGCPCGP